MKKYALALLPVVWAAQAQATILPPNDLHKQDNFLFTANISEEEFGKIVDHVIDIYKPLAKEHGATLKVNKRWEDATVNASASQFLGSWTVNMYGGLARRPEVTPDGFAMVVCHEIGHHFGGFPYSSSWAANEGQSDYFATQSCARQIWANQPEVNATFRETVTGLVQDRCDRAWTKTEDQNLCYRNAAAGESLAKLLAAISDLGVPSFETPDLNVVTKTNNAHPKAQCRMDTYLAGSTCNAAFDIKLIPGKETSGGRAGEKAETEASKQSCMAVGKFEMGLRPTCWFKPRM